MRTQRYYTHVTVQSIPMYNMSYTTGHGRRRVSECSARCKCARPLISNERHDDGYLYAVYDRCRARVYKSGVLRLSRTRRRPLGA